MFVRDDLRPLQRRLVGILALVGAVSAILLARLWQLQVAENEHWLELAESNRLRRLPLEAPRGLVADDAGRVLLSNRPTFQLLVFPEEIEDRERTVAFLARIGVAGADELRARLGKAMQSSHLPTVIADNLSWAQMAAVAAHRVEYGELEVHPSTRRAVPLGAAAAHLVGQLGEVSPQQLAADPGLRPGQLVGKSGLERAYDGHLGGKPGNMVVVVDAVGRQVSTVREEQPVPGHSLTVTVDLEVQRAAATALAGQVGAVVALDPRDGALRALVSEPSFDPDLFAGHLAPLRWQELVESPLKPLNNRPLQALYPPGSTIKPLFAAAALSAGLRSPGSAVFCNGAVTLYGHRYRCWNAGGHGRVAVEEAIEASCDSYFYHLAADAGIDTLAAWARMFGFGRATGIELPGEASGLVPDDAWSRRTRGHGWYAGETVSVGIGQGPILATPLQLAVAYAALLNGGRLVRPHVVSGGETPGVPLGLSQEALAVVRSGMQRVVAGDRGTARAQSGAPVRLAGKTGTSQVVAKKEGVRWQQLPWEQRHHALFVGYAPPESPRLVVVVVVEHGGDAAAAAAPVAAQVIAAAFGPDEPVQALPTDGLAAEAQTLDEPPAEPTTDPPAAGPTGLAGRLP